MINTQQQRADSVRRGSVLLMGGRGTTETMGRSSLNASSARRLGGEDVYAARPDAWQVALAAILTAVIVAPLAWAQDRGGIRVTIRDNQNQVIGGYANSYALVIGVSRYKYWNPLKGVLDDVKEVELALEEHGFEVTVELDPDHEQLPKAIRSFITRKGLTKNDRLLVYFAGHGHTVTNFGDTKGYIVPIDAPVADDEGFVEKALPMSTLEDWAAEIRTTHALFIFDSCFSGALFAETRSATRAPPHINSKMAEPVRQFITSGSANEEVPDESIFRRKFVDALNGEGDTDGDGYVTASEMGQFLHKEVVNASPRKQTPQIGKIRNSNFRTGDFVFPLPGLAESKRVDAALDKLHDNSRGGPITGTMYDEIAQALRSDAPRRLQEVILEAIDALDGSKLSQYAVEGVWRTHREKLLVARPLPEIASSVKKVSPPPPPPPTKIAKKSEPSAADKKATGSGTKPVRPKPQPPREPTPGELILRFERETAAFGQQGQAAGVLSMVEKALPQAQKHVEMTGVLVWALDYLPARSGTPLEKEKARQLEELLLAPLREEHPPPPAASDDWAVISSGSFRMGNVKGASDDKPVHDVTISQPFRMLNHEVTNRELRRLFPEHSGNDELPAANVSWYQAYAYAAWLGGRLPTEAEWEWAARAECVHELCTHDADEKAKLGDVAWWAANSGGNLHPVRGREPNPWGLYDMIGNAWEWTADWFGNYSTLSQTDPWGPPGGQSRAKRGASFRDYGSLQKPTYRNKDRASTASKDIGFRVVLPAGNP